MDLDPFGAVGITADTIRCLDIFLLHCLLTESPADTPQEIEANGRNKQKVAARGRDSGLRLERDGGRIELREWAGEVLTECEPIAAALDAAHGGSAYRAALAKAIRTVDDPALLPSARVLHEMAKRYDGSHGRFAIARSIAHRSTLVSAALPTEIEASFTRMSQESIDAQRKIEATDELPFEEYRRQYLSSERLGVG
jgi:glutamate--cysteine ligase